MFIVVAFILELRPGILFVRYGMIEQTVSGDNSKSLINVTSEDVVHYGLVAPRGNRSDVPVVVTEDDIKFYGLAEPRADRLEVENVSAKDIERYGKCQQWLSFHFSADYFNFQPEYLCSPFLWYPNNPIAYLGSRQASQSRPGTIAKAST